VTRSVLATFLLAAALPHALQSLQPRTSDAAPKRGAPDTARADSAGVGVRIVALEFQRGPYVTIELERPADVSLWVVVKRQRPALAWPQPRGSFRHSPDRIHLSPGRHVLRLPLGFGRYFGRGADCSGLQPPARCVTPPVFVALAAPRLDRTRLDSVLALEPHKPESDVLRQWLWPYPGVDSTVSRLGELLTGADVTWTADRCALDPTWDFRAQGPQACAGDADPEDGSGDPQSWRPDPERPRRGQGAERGASG